MNEECALAQKCQGGVLCRRVRAGDRRKYVSVRETETKKNDDNHKTSVRLITGFRCDDTLQRELTNGLQRFVWKQDI